MLLVLRIYVTVEKLRGVFSDKFRGQVLFTFREICDHLFAKRTAHPELVVIIAVISDQLFYIVRQLFVTVLSELSAFFKILFSELFQPCLFLC